jgi:hypothetical protein
MQAAPQWTVTSVSRPTNFCPAGAKACEERSGKPSYRILVTDTGGASSDGTPITITDELPPGLSIDPVGASGEDRLATVHNENSAARFHCLLGTCVYNGVVDAGDTLALVVPIDVQGGAPGSVTNVVRVSGGGAEADASVSTPTTISEAEASFGISPGGATTALSSTQAGAHPDMTTSIAFNTVAARGALAGDPKDTVDDLPTGFAGDLIDTPTCSDAQFSLVQCPIDTQVGVVTVVVDLLGESKSTTFTEPLYNLTPNPGEVSKLGFRVGTTLAIEGEVAVRPSDYGLEAIFRSADESPAELDNVSLTLWGVPSAPVHDPLRWNPSSSKSQFEIGSFGVASQAKKSPFFTNPTVCSGALLSALFTVNSWAKPEEFKHAEMPFGPISGCDRLTFPSSFEVEPTTERAYAPTGLNVKLNVEQTYDNAEGLATSALNRAVVTLPEGMTVNPSAGAGLGACSEAQYAEETIETVPGRGCPPDSKLGTVQIKTPVFEEEATGSVYIAQPYANPFNALIGIYVVARFADRGVLVRVAGEVTPDERTGQLVTTFYRQPALGDLAALEGLPPVPFTHFTFKFRQGETSPLVTPPRCGSYAAAAALTPWSELEAVLARPAPAFTIAQGFDGGPCPSGGAPPFSPSVIAGTQDNSAAAYSPMYIRVIRGDGEQEITRFSAQLPPGLTANLSGVPFCSDQSIQIAKQKTGAQEEAEPSCPAASQIGHTLVGAGVGSVLAWAPGRVYMAGPYNGAPFSIVAITSAKVGPFDLGTVVVREALRIDPTTAVVTVDATASDPIPHIIRGIVVHVRDIRVYIDRPRFSLNPTSCRSMVFNATVTGAGADIANPADDVPVTVADRFQAANCGSLRFQPTFKVATSGRTSRKNGASLNVSLTYPNAPQGTQANIRSVKVNLPRQLPSRLSTLQKACTDHVFNQNPASCPYASKVGMATAITPILPVPLIGPAYFVSHGGARFPELIIVLQGYGVTVDLHGETFISKAGITSSTFRSVPDQPVSSFHLTLPQGPNSALAAGANLCKAKSLKMPTAFTAQSGAAIHKTTIIAVTGCPKTKNKKKAKK